MRSSAQQKMQVHCEKLFRSYIQWIIQLYDQHIKWAKALFEVIKNESFSDLYSEMFFGTSVFSIALKWCYEQKTCTEKNIRCIRVWVRTPF